MNTKGSIKGSVPGSVPFLVFEVMKKIGKPMSSAQVYAQFAPELNLRRISVNTALNELASKKIVEKTGARGSMLFSLTGIQLPIRVPVPRYWDLKKRPIDGAPSPEQKKPNANTIKPFWNDSKAPLAQANFPKPFRIDTPVRICCNECEWYGPTSGCTDCKYEFERREKAA